jgi:hypothetical protein
MRRRMAWQKSSGHYRALRIANENGSLIIAHGQIEEAGQVWGQR